MKGELTKQEVLVALRTACETAGGLRAFAREHNLQSSHVSEMLCGVRQPQAAICEALGIERTVKFFWKKAGPND